MRIGLLMLLDALLISASLLMGLQVYYDMHAPAAHILHVWRSLPLLIVSTVAFLHMMASTAASSNTRAWICCCKSPAVRSAARG